jgi:long-chain acyl-CoA synthetase
VQITQTIQRAARLFPDNRATVFGERTRTWRDVVARVSRIAGALQSLGLRRGDYVPVLAFNSDRYIELAYAIPWAGGIFVPINVRWTASEILDALSEVAPRVIFLDDSFLPMADALCSGLRSLVHVISIGEKPTDRYPHYEALAESHDPIDDAGRCKDDEYTRFYTGGTTGKPRGVSISHRNAVFASLSYIAELQLTSNMVHLHVGGMFHLSGAGHMWYTSMVGGCNVILPKFEPLPVLRAIHTHRITNTVLLPTMVNMMLTREDFGEYDLTSMRTCIYGGSPMPATLIESFMERLPTWSFVQVYAMTETCGLGTFLPWNLHVSEGGRPSKINSVGRVALGVDLKVIDSVGDDVPSGQVGEIAVRGPNVMLSYAERTFVASYAGDFLRTGDLGWLDEDHFVYIVDRAKDMIISGGENVYSAEVENAIYKHPAVRECAVVAAPDPAWGETILAIVVLKDGTATTEAEIIAHCRGLIAGYKCPKRVVIREDPLPVSPTGKIKKDILRAPYWTDSAVRIA